MTASDLYRGAAGPLYWERNAPSLRATGSRRSHALHALVPFPVPWLEIGCGQGYNLMPADVGIDIDRRTYPDIVADVRDGIPCKDRSFAVAFCVGLLMHFPSCSSLTHDEGEKCVDYVLEEMGRVARKAVIIGEYVAEVEKDRLWDYTDGSFGHGQPGLVWERPYAPPPGFHLTRTEKLSAFGEDVTFLVFERDGRSDGVG